MADYTDPDGGVIGSYTPALDVIEGWNNKVSGSNTLAIDGLVPFVQLIGIYSEDQIKKITGEETNGREVSFVNDPNNVSWNDEENPINTTSQTEYFENKIRSKYVGLNIQSYHQPESDVYVPGIVLATSASQVGDTDVYGHHSGGVGITELQIQSGTKEFTNRRYTLKLTVTDPQFLNDKPEYFKLSSLQSTFLIIHGWANAGDIPGWTGDAPPSIQADTTGVWPNGTLSVNLKDPKTGGAWSAATVATTMFDFAFNEMGQLEASFSFMPREISFLNTYRVPLVSTIIRNFLGTGEMMTIGQDPEGTFRETRPIPRFAGLVAGFGAAVGTFGKNMADVIAEEQAAYFAGSNVQSRYANINDTLGFNVSDSLRNFSDNIIDWSAEQEGDFSTLSDITQVINTQKRNEGQNRFPYAGPGIRSYTKSNRTILSGDGTEINITEYNTKIIYYSLGWVLEALRMSMFDVNKNKVLRGEKPFDVKFRYFPIPRNSFFNLSYQSSIRDGILPQINKFIAESIVNFQELALPRQRVWNPRYQELNTRNVEVNLAGEQVARATNEDGVPTEDDYTLKSNYKVGKNEEMGRYNIQPITAEQIRTDPIFEAVGGQGVTGAGARDRSSLLGKGQRAYQLMLPSTLGGKFSELQNLGDDRNLLTYEFRKLWEDLTKNEKFSYIPGTAEHKMQQMFEMEESELLTRTYLNPWDSGPAITADYRKSLVETGADDPAGPGLVRIMHPEFEGQLLYSYSWDGAIQIRLNIYDLAKLMTPPSGDRTPAPQDYTDDEVGADPPDWTDAALAEARDNPHHTHGVGDCALRLLLGWNGWSTAATDADWMGSTGGFLISHVKNFFVGEIIAGVEEVATNIHDTSGVKYVKMDEYKPPPEYGKGFGIIMPAIAARYYHPNAYSLAQRRWYNKHIEFLKSHFSNLIRNRMQLAVTTGIPVKSIMYEPVDLAWLTGKKYNFDTPIWPGAGSAATMAKYARYYSGHRKQSREYHKMWQPPGNNQPHRNAILEIGRITEEAELVIIDQSQAIETLEYQKNQKIDQKEDIEDVLNGTTGTPGSDYFIAIQQLRTLPPLSETTYNDVRSIEDSFMQIAMDRMGLVGQLEWWQERLGIVLVELYNRDLIDLPESAIVFDPEERTYASSVGTTEEGNKLDAADRFKISSVKVDNALWFKNLKEDFNGYRGFYTVGPALAAYQSTLWGDLAEEFDMVRFANYNNYAWHRINRWTDEEAWFEESRWARQDFFDYVIKMEFDPFEIPVINDNAPGMLGRLNFDVNKSGVNYLYENYIDPSKLRVVEGQNIIEGYQLGTFMAERGFGFNDLIDGGWEHYEDAVSGDGNWPTIGEQTNLGYMMDAFDKYATVVHLARRLASRYVERIKEIENLIIQKSADLDNIKKEIRIDDEIIEDHQEIIDVLEGNVDEVFSPFMRETVFDATKKRDLGGGRSVDIYGLPAQQWDARFQPKVVCGSTDIAFYRMPRGGIEHSVIKTGRHIWSNTEKWSTEGSTDHLDKIRTDLSGSRLANLDNWDEPKSILNMDKIYNTGHFYEWAPIGHDIKPFWYYGDTGTKPDEWGFKVQPKAIFSVPFDDNGVNFSRASRNRLFATGLKGQWNLTPKVRKKFSTFRDEYYGWEFIEGEMPFPENLDVAHLVRAGLVNEGLIKEQVQKKFDASGMDVPQSIGFEDDQGVTIKIVGKWPIYTVPLWRGQNASSFYPYGEEIDNPGILTNYIGPAYLVDEDLDFVAQAKDVLYPGDFKDDGTLKSGTDAELGLCANITADTWIKIGMNFVPEESGAIKMYDGVNSLPLYKNNHLPNITIDMARSVVKNYARYEESYSSPEGHVPDRYAELLATQLDIGVEDLDFTNTKHAIAHSQSTSNNYDDQKYSFQGINFRGSLFAGRIPYNEEYPFGIPNAVRKNVDTQVNGYGIGSPEPSFPAGPNSIGVQLGGEEETVSREAISYNKNYSYNFPRAVDFPYNIEQQGGPSAGVLDPNGDNVRLPGADRFKDYDKGGVCVNDILNTLPQEFERGFFSSVKYANKDFEEGEPIHPGVEKWISENVINLFTNGRRVALRGKTPSLNNMSADVCYNDLLPRNLVEIIDTFADFTNQSIQSVAEIPIKRVVVDNLLNKRNQNMSLNQFLRQILAPSSIALSGNVQLGVRYNQGLIDIIPASIEYKGVIQDMFQKAISYNTPSDQLLFDYKKRNSLIENIDMSSKMDPAAFLTYQNSAELLQGRDYNVLKLLSYEGIAEDFKEYLDNTAKPDDSGQTYSGIISITTDNQVNVDKVRFQEIPSTIVDGFISLNPGRWATLTALLQSQNNFTTELLAFYMRGVTLTLHGTTNIMPFNLINVKGVLPDLEGVYIITNVTEKIVPTGFQTILEGKLLKKRRDVELPTQDWDEIFGGGITT